ncbi:hypothetical protein CHISP_0239 [Chitinispirillum alkaliphilum]|nr:hypothetical protein CHISP_0239 [Chitinispirillum alkaliphilum]
MKTDLQNVKHLRAGDFLVAAILLTGAVLIWPMLQSSHPELVVIFRDNRVIARYPLNEDAHVLVNGENGPVGISISEGKTWINSVNCPHQICRRSGYIHRSYEQLICVPNRLLVQIHSSGDNEQIDAITY